MKQAMHTEWTAVLLSGWFLLRACFKIPRGAVFAQKAGWRGGTREHSRQRSVTEEQRSQTAFCAKTLRAAGLLPLGCGGSAGTARRGGGPPPPPCPEPKSLAAAPLAILKHALSPLVFTCFILLAASPVRAEFRAGIA